MTPLLSIRDLTIAFDTEAGCLAAVSNLTLELAPGETLGLVGESGCGKTVTALSILRLLPSPPARLTSGQILFDGEDLLRLPAAGLRRVRGRRIGMIFQEPMQALSPLQRIGAQLAEVLSLHRLAEPSRYRAVSLEWLQRVGIPEPAECLKAYPHQLSGGMRQRAMIAMAMVAEPDLLIADEPTTALDVTIQAQILELMRTVRRPETALLLITHDLAVVWEMCSRVAVMYAGEIVETGSRAEVFGQPWHPYTEALLAAMPAPAGAQRRPPSTPAQAPPLTELPAGCRFAPRCPYALPACTRHPDLDTHADRQVRCWRAAERHHLA
ncbi:MAG: ABC transporter ATP-binding protein [Candidatus Marinimicrobia bacterium]|nr:ABC transporter ATP-binding protein [Candidatus Neomarinimicrobiota bacterium]